MREPRKLIMDTRNPQEPQEDTKSLLEPQEDTKSLLEPQEDTRIMSIIINMLPMVQEANIMLLGITTPTQVIAITMEGRKRSIKTMQGIVKGINSTREVPMVLQKSTIRKDKFNFLNSYFYFTL